MTPKVTIDPRLHDAVIFVVTQTNSLTELMRRLHDGGVATAILDVGASDAQALRATAQRMGTRAERSVVVDATPDGVTTARAAGFALVIGLAPTDGELVQLGADAVVNDLDEIAVRTGDRRMSEIPNALESYRQLADLMSDRRPAICLDYDGTLSEIVRDPDSAELVDGAADALARLSQRSPVAILSGRDLADIRERVGVPGLWYAGSHGFESIAPDGSYRQNDEAAAAVPVLEQAAEELREMLAHIDGSRVEHKRFAVAVHYRDVAAENIGDVIASTHRIGRRDGLRVTNGRKVVELRPDVDWNKGTTLSWIREQIGPPPVLPIYIGDDLTDEDAFDAIRDDGIGILVRHTEDGDRRSAARFTLQTPDQVREFLDHIANQLPDAHREA
jgi:trehalose-phosphatase